MVEHQEKNIRKKTPSNVVLTTCTVQKPLSHRGKTKGIFHIVMFYPLVFCLWLKSFPREVDFFPILHPENARRTDYTVGTLVTRVRFRGSGGRIDPQRWRSGKEITLKWLLRNSSSYVTDSG